MEPICKSTVSKVWHNTKQQIFWRKLDPKASSHWAKSIARLARSCSLLVKHRAITLRTRNSTLPTH
jgi:hypothetical protein